MKNFKEAFGSKIHNIRKSKKLTIETFAEMVDLSSRQITRIESGDNFPSAETICKICMALKTEPKILFDFDWYDNLMYFSTGAPERPQLKVIVNSKKAIIAGSLSIRGQDLNLKETVPNTEILSFLINFAQEKNIPFVVEFFEKRERTKIMRILPDGQLQKIIDVEDLKIDQATGKNKDYEYILEKIKMFESDENKLEYLKASIDALNNKAALAKVKSILKGVELTL